MTKQGASSFLAQSGRESKHKLSITDRNEPPPTHTLLLMPVFSLTASAPVIHVAIATTQARLDL